VTHLVILGTLPAGSHTLGKDTKALSTSRAWSKEESNTKESSKRCPTVPGLRHHPKGCSLRLCCTLVGHPDHILFSIFQFNILSPFLVARFSFKPGFLWLTPEVCQPHWPPLIDLVQSRKRAQKAAHDRTQSEYQRSSELMRLWEALGPGVFVLRSFFKVSQASRGTKEP
jgi:hypothetical protein